MSENKISTVFSRKKSSAANELENDFQSEDEDEFGGGEYSESEEDY